MTFYGFLSCYTRFLEHWTYQFYQTVILYYVTKQDYLSIPRRDTLFFLLRH